jgi:aryl-alcohol dehydrogenase-like predicted oxidoreductase
MLSGKVNATGTAPDGTRLAIESNMGERWITPNNLRLVRLLNEWANGRGHTVLELAFAWLLAEPIVATVIAGASSPAQIESNAKAADWRLTQEERVEVTAILDANPAENGGDYYSAAGYFSQPTVELPRPKP